MSVQAFSGRLLVVLALPLWGLTAKATDARDADDRQASTRTVIEWTFDRDGDLEGWQPNGHLTDVGGTNGVLHLRAVGSDPILELRPLLTMDASPWHVLELRLAIHIPSATTMNLPIQERRNSPFW